MQASGRSRPEARLGAHEGRLTGDYAGDEVEYFYKPLVEGMRYLFRPVMQYNLAHVVMLTEQGILDRERAGTLLATLREVLEAGVDAIEMDPRLQSLYPNIEALVIDRCGYNVGGMLYLGRSRGDAQNQPFRMAQRQWLLDIMAEVLEIRQATLDLAEKHAETLLPGYTHLQHTQPMSFGFYMLWFAEALEADCERLMGAYKRVNQSGAEIGVGLTSSFPMNRERVAELLGYEGLIENGQLAHRGLDREQENLFVLSLLGQNMFRLCEDFLFWCSTDVNFMELDDEYSATSFMMAQKKNPAALNHVEVGAMVAHSTLETIHQIAMRNTSEVAIKGSLAVTAFEEAARTVYGSCRIMRGMLPGIVLHTDRMLDSIVNAFCQGTDLADALVRETGLSFREAHRVVGTMVRRALARGLKPAEVTPEFFREAAEEAIGQPATLSPEALRQVMDPLESIRAKRVTGGTAPDMVRQSIQRKSRQLAEDRAWLEQKRARLAEAETALTSACDAILSGPA
jgi:argininosuccinate lyase